MYPKNFPERNKCFLNEMDDCCNVLRRNRLVCESLAPVPARDMNDSNSPPRRSSKPTIPISKGTRGKASSKLKSIGSSSSGGLSDPSKKISNSSTDTKQMKNSQNYQYQDMLGKKHMEVINEELEDPKYPTDSIRPDSQHSKKIQESCADFLSIVHDNVVDTVQKSVEAILRDYFVHTMSKIDGLCSQIMRNECLLNKMYLDVMDKLTEQNENNLCQFKCVCQLLMDMQQTQANKNCADYNEEAMFYMNPSRTAPTTQRKVTRRNSDMNSAEPLYNRAYMNGNEDRVKSTISTPNTAKPSRTYSPVKEESDAIDESFTSMNFGQRDIRRNEYTRVARRSSDMSNTPATKRFKSTKTGQSVEELNVRNGRN